MTPQPLELLATVAPRALTRAQMLADAIAMRWRGQPRADIARALVARYGVCRMTAYRIIAMAWDMAGPA